MFLEFSPNTEDKVVFMDQLFTPNISNLLEVVDKLVDNYGYVCSITVFRWRTIPMIVIHVSIGTYGADQFNFPRLCLDIENYEVKLINPLSALSPKMSNRIILHRGKQLYYTDTFSGATLYGEKCVHIRHKQYCWAQVRNIIVDHITVCPRLTLDSSFFQLISLDKICITELDFCENSGYFKKENDNIIMCAENYMSVAVSYHHRSSDSNGCPSYSLHSTMNLLSLIMTCLSALCLLSTITVYCVCSSLRTIPGKNNLFLCVTLLTAQCITAFGIGQTQLGIGCQVIGALIHYFWLSSISWMNACSIHMFRVFAFTRATVLKDESLTYKYALYCLLVPLPFVGANILYSWQFRDGDFGYGGKCMCYFSSRNLHIITFGVPIAVLIVANVILFLISIVKIHRIKSLDRSRDMSTDIKNYFKLSSLTGVMWIWGFMYSFTSHEAFAYIFITHNLGQGILIFVSFICNFRVYNLLFNRNSFYDDSQIVKTKRVSCPVTSR